MPRQFENTIRIRGGDERIISWSNSVLRNAGRAVGTLSFGVDVTEPREQEKRLKEYKNRLKALASELTITEERERRRIAEKLHDGPIQVLAFARMRLASAREQAYADERDRALVEVSEALRQATIDASRVVTDLSSAAMKELGLTAAISDWAEEQVQRRFGIKTTVSNHLDEADERALDDLTRALLFRSTRELLANVAKHAQAGSVHVLLERAGSDLVLTVRDDGQGCDPEATLDCRSSDCGYGLFSIRERMADLGGALEIDTEPGKGFAATLITPLGARRSAASVRVSDGIARSESE